MTEVERALGPRARLGAYDYWRGYFNFYSKRDRIPVAHTAEDVARFFHDPGEACMIVRERDVEELEAAAGAPLVRMVEDGVGSKSLVLACRLASPQAANTGTQVSAERTNP